MVGREHVISAVSCVAGAEAQGSLAGLAAGSDVEDLGAPLAAELTALASPAGPGRCCGPLLFGIDPSSRRRCRLGWGLGLLSTGLACVVFLLSAHDMDTGAPGRNGAAAGGGEETADALSLYVNISALSLGEAGKPSQYLFLKGIEEVGDFTQHGIQVRQGECAMDIVQTTQYLARAGLQITQAAKTCKPELNVRGSETFEGHKYVKTACAADAAGILSSFSYVATYLSLAATTCGQTVNFPAYCAEGAAGLIAALAKISSEAAIMAANCKGGAVYNSSMVPPAVAGSDAIWQNDRRLKSIQVNESARESLAEAMQALNDTWKSLHSFNDSVNYSENPAWQATFKMERDGELATCVIDATQAATYLAHAGVSGAHCRAPGTLDTLNTVKTGFCAGSILNIVSGVINAGAFVASAVSHCALGLDVQALCAASAVGLVAAVTELMQFVLVLQGYCDVIPEIVDNVIDELR